MKAVTQLRAELSALPGVIEASSRFGRHPAWRIDGREFAHLHSDSLIDLRLPRPEQARLRKDPRAHFRRHPWAWVELEFHTTQDVLDLLVLAQQAAKAAKRRATRSVASHDESTQKR